MNSNHMPESHSKTFVNDNRRLHILNVKDEFRAGSENRA